MNRRSFFQRVLGLVVGLIGCKDVCGKLPYIPPEDIPPVPPVKPLKSDKIKVVRIFTHDEGEFVCGAKKEWVNDFIRNYRKKNEQRLKAKGYKALIPKLQIEEWSEEKYNSMVVTTLSVLYFNGIEV